MGDQNLFGFFSDLCVRVGDLVHLWLGWRRSCWSKTNRLSEQSHSCSCELDSQLTLWRSYLSHWFILGMAGRWKDVAIIWIYKCLGVSDHIYSLCGQNVFVELVIYKDQVASDHAISWAPLSPKWIDTITVLGATMKFHVQMTWVLMVPIFFLTVRYFRPKS